MNDICKCANQECPIKENCYRHTAPSGDGQVWAKFEYKDGCEDYWPVKEEK